MRRGRWRLLRFEEGDLLLLLLLSGWRRAVGREGSGMKPHGISYDIYIYI